MDIIFIITLVILCDYKKNRHQRTYNNSLVSKIRGEKIGIFLNINPINI